VSEGTSTLDSRRWFVEIFKKTARCTHFGTQYNRSDNNFPAAYHPDLAIDEKNAFNGAQLAEDCGAPLTHFVVARHQHITTFLETSQTRRKQHPFRKLSHDDFDRTAFPW
jgi:hypothetical protein